MSRSGRYEENANILPPSLDEFGHRPFSKRQLQALAERLQDAQWPRGALNIYGLEGLLTAMLVLSTGLRPAVWLSLIWNGSGWKIPAALQGADDFQEFIELIVGFMRGIDSGFLATPSRFDSVLDTLAARYRPETPHSQKDWALGFALAVNQSALLDFPQGATAHRALQAIAMHTKLQPTSVHECVDASPSVLQQAALTLAATRMSRGPLGPLM
jgi:yecA family protein